jgi:hypothetical protein
MSQPPSPDTLIATAPAGSRHPGRRSTLALSCSATDYQGLTSKQASPAGSSHFL